MHLNRTLFGTDNEPERNILKGALKLIIHDH